MVETGMSSRSLYCQCWNHEKKKKKKVMGKENRIPDLAIQVCPRFFCQLLSPRDNPVYITRGV